MNRRLALRREVLTELTDTDLAGVGGGSQGTCAGSCLMFVSCHLSDCISPRTRLEDCVAVQTVTCP